MAKFAFHCILRAYRAVIMNYALALALALALAELCQQQSDIKVGAEGTNTHKNIFSSAFLAGKLEFPAKALSHWLEISHSALPLPPCCHFAGFLIIHTVFNQYARQSEHFKESHPRSIAPLLHRPSNAILWHFAACRVEVEAE